MPKRVVLVEPAHRTRYDFEYVPTGLLSIAAVLKAEGHSVLVFRSADSLPACDILGVSVSMPQYNDALGILQRTDAGVRIIGGPYVTAAPVDAVRSSLITYGVMGDGEMPMLMLLDNRPKHNIPGLVYRYKGAYCINPKADLPSCRIPVPDYSALQGTVRQVRPDLEDQEYTLVGNAWSYAPRYRNVLSFSNEIAALIDLGVRGVFVSDEVFCGGHSGVTSAVRALDRFEFWQCRATPGIAIKNRLDQKLRGSHCSLVEVGIITASKRLRAEIGSPELDMAELAIGLLVGAGLKVRLHVTLGLPGETVGSLEETEAWLEKLGLPVRASTFVAYPGDVWYEEQEKYEHFGFAVTGRECKDFWIDDAKDAHALPWKSGVIDTEKFLLKRNEMVKKYNLGQQWA